MVSLKISNSINTFFAFSPSMMNLNTSTMVQEISNTSNQRRDRPISLAIICNHINKQFWITFHTEMWNFIMLCYAISKPKYKPHISAYRTSQTPILRTYPLSHLPLISRRRPSQPAWSPFSFHAPWQSSLTIPCEEASNQWKLFQCADDHFEEDYWCNLQ